MRSPHREVTTAYLREVFVGIAAHGFGRLPVLNHHVEPAHFTAVHKAAKQAKAATGANVVVPDHRRRPFVDAFGKEYTSAGE